jgi:hypothetical protein
MSFAFGAFLRIDDVHVVLETNGGVGTLEFTGAAHGALRGDDFVGHLLTPKARVDAGYNFPFKPRARTQSFDFIW